MLVLSRKVGESVLIGNNIKVTVLQLEGNNIRLGFDAPNDVVIHREEVFNRINKEKDVILVESEFEEVE